MRIHSKIKLSNEIKTGGVSYWLMVVDKTELTIFKKDEAGKYSREERVSDGESDLFDEVSQLIGDSVSVSTIRRLTNSIKPVFQLTEDIPPEIKKGILFENESIQKENIEDLRLKIFELIETNKEIKPLLLSNWLISKYDFVLDETGTVPYRISEKGYIKMDCHEVIELLSLTFGENITTPKKAEEVLSQIAQKRIEQDYNIIQFSNGLFNTATGEFVNDVKEVDCLPKFMSPLSFPVEDWTNWDGLDEKYKNTPLYTEIKTRLSCDWEWNEDLFYYWVANCLMATNELEGFVIFYGGQDTGKSTLTTLFKRIFKDYTSMVKLEDLNNSNKSRFASADTIGNHINIDDDIASATLEDTGSLKSFVTGTGLRVEPKYGKGVNLNRYTTPKFMCCANNLPKCERREGYHRRLILILVPNTIEKTDNAYINNIENGKIDNEIGLMMAYSLKKYYEAKIVGKTIIDSEMRDAMWDYYQSQQKKQNISNYEIYDEAIEECFIGKTEVLKRLDDLKEVGQIEDYKYKGATLQILNNENWEEIPNYARKEDVEQLISEHIEKKDDSILIEHGDIVEVMKRNYEYKRKRIIGDKRDSVFNDCMSKSSLERLFENVPNVPV